MKCETQYFFVMLCFENENSTLLLPTLGGRMFESLSCFKAYDIRGKLGLELNKEIAYRVGRAYGELFKPKTIAVGNDIRLTSSQLKLAVADGLMDAGVDVLDLGLVGTEEVYYAASHLDVDGGIEVTASHNPMDYNGMKLVGENARPISNESGLLEIKEAAERNDFLEVDKKGKLTAASILAPYVDHLMGYLDSQAVKPLKIVVNSGNGVAGHVIDELERRFEEQGIPIEFVKVHHSPDGHFPNGIPNPLLKHNRQDTIDAVINHQANLGIAWDGDFDRCFLFDENGRFIEGYYIVGLLAAAFLTKSPKSKIIHDPRLTWNTIDIVESLGGKAIQSKTGHAYIKARMRLEDAIYGGEMSAHHYFRDFNYCDSGMIPWLLIVSLLSHSNKTLSDMLNENMEKFPSSGEINRSISDPERTLERVKEHYQEQALVVDETDGISIEFENWRFNLRVSNTEPLVRLNVESKANQALMEEKRDEVLSLL